MTIPGQLVAFVATTDLAVATEFYRDRLGLSLTETNPYAAVFDVGGTELRVTAVPAKAPASYTVLGWSVADLTSAVADVRAQGISLNRYDGMDQDADDAWSAPDGTRVCWFDDPDGNVLSLHQTVS